MDDDRITEFERALWIGEGDIYRRCVATECLMVVPEEPFVLRGEEAIQAVEQTPRWSEVELDDLQINRAQEGLIVIAYKAQARRGDERYVAYCTSTYQRVAENEWRVIQHQQTLPPSTSGSSGPA
jgi:hypothetical protein